jgi:hypothetical protein
MHRRILVGILPVSLMLLLAAIAVPLRAQSLADLSRQEEERRKTIKVPAKVYTNKDLGQAPPAPSAQPPAGAKSEGARDADKEPGEKADKEKDKDRPAGTAKDQVYWSTRLKTLQAQLDRDQTYVDALQSRISALTTDFVSRGDPAQRAVVERNRQKAVAEFERLKLAILEDKKAIAGLEDEARRAGVPPGWLR